MTASGERVALAGVETTDDAFLGGALQILQPKRGYRAGLDAVLLAAAAPLPAGAACVRVIDAGAGVGVVGLCLARRLGNVHVTLVERDPALAALARENAARNALADRVEVIEADVTAPLGASAALAERAGAFELALANPPYHAAEAGTPAADALKAQAHAMPDGSLDDWLRFLAAMVRPRGRVALVHRAEALDDVMQACRRRFGALRVWPVHPRVEEVASRIIVTGSKGSRAPVQILPGLVVHAPGGGFTDPLEAALRKGCALPLPAGR